MLKHTLIWVSSTCNEFITERFSYSHAHNCYIMSRCGLVLTGIGAMQPSHLRTPVNAFLVQSGNVPTKTVPEYRGIL